MVKWSAYSSSTPKIWVQIFSLNSVKLFEKNENRQKEARIFGLQDRKPPRRRTILLKMGHPRPLFRLFPVFSNKQCKFCNKLMWKNVHLVSGCRDSNSQLSESPPLTTRPELPPRPILLHWIFLCFFQVNFRIRQKMPRSLTTQSKYINVRPSSKVGKTWRRSDYMPDANSRNENYLDQNGKKFHLLIETLLMIICMCRHGQIFLFKIWIFYLRHFVLKTNSNATFQQATTLQWKNKLTVFNLLVSKSKTGTYIAHCTLDPILSYPQYLPMVTST